MLDLLFHFEHVCIALMLVSAHNNQSGFNFCDLLNYFLGGNWTVGAKSFLSRARRLNTDVSYWADKEATALRLEFVKPEVISWSSHIIVFHNFLSPEECDYLRAIAKPWLQVSTVVDARTGKGMKSKVRTSSGMFLSVEERKYPMIEAIEKRISVYSQLPVENGERIQVLRYEKDQLYRPHHDYFSDTFNLEHGGQRVATMLMHLSDNVEGGETYFPQAKNRECICGGEKVPGLCVKPVKGDAVLFWSMPAWWMCSNLGRKMVSHEMDETRRHFMRHVEMQEGVYSLDFFSMK